MEIKNKIFGWGATTAILTLLIWSGFYPVAFVGWSPIFSSTWRKVENAEKQFANVQAHSLGLAIINFSSLQNADLKIKIRKDTLLFLIENKIMEQEGPEVVADFNKMVKKRVGDALRLGGSMKDAARVNYNLSEDDFEKLILWPQARQDVLNVFLEQQGIQFNDWMNKKKTSKKIRLVFNPFSWEGGKVK